MESTGTYPSSYINTVKGGATAPLAPLFLRPWPMQDTLRLEVELASYYYSPCSDFQAPLIACNKSSEDGLTVWGGGYTLSK